MNFSSFKPIDSFSPLSLSLYIYITFSFTFKGGTDRNFNPLPSTFSGYMCVTCENIIIKRQTKVWKVFFLFFSFLFCIPIKNFFSYFYFLQKKKYASIIFSKKKLFVFLGYYQENKKGNGVENYDQPLHINFIREDFIINNLSYCVIISDKKKRKEKNLREYIKIILVTFCQIDFSFPPPPILPPPCSQWKKKE